jgi:transposase-like protein
VQGKNYSSEEKLKIINRVKSKESKASLFHKCGIPEESGYVWIKEEGNYVFVSSYRRQHMASKKESWNL